MPARAGVTIARARLRFSILAALCVLFALCARAEDETRDIYDITLYMLPYEQAARVEMSLTYTNRTGETLSRVMFNVYGNCFRRESSLPYDAEALYNAFPDGYAPGGLDFYFVGVNGARADWGVLGEDESFMRVECALAPGETCVFSFGYMLSLTDNHAFLGCGDDDWRFIYFYPSACVYEYGEFTTNPPTDAGEFFYADIADFNVKLYAPEGYAVACGGASYASPAENGYTRHDISLERAREFSAVVSRKFHSYEAAAASGAVIHVCAGDRALARRALSAATRALDIFEAWFGEYPYPRLTLARASAYVDSLSLSALIILGDEAYTGAEDLEYRVYRAVASEYFGVIAQPNMALEAWLDEAASEYAALLITHELEGENKYLRKLNSRVLPALQITIPGGLKPDSYTARFASMREYRLITRLRGAAVINELTRAMGREAMISALGQYARANRFGITSIADFASALETSTGRAWDDALLAWLYAIDDYSNEILDYYD